MREPVLVSSIDGVGTKLKLAVALDRHDTIGQDLVNHCVNDIAVLGARPLFFLDYLGTGKLEPAVFAQILAGLAKACAAAGCALIGGETAQMPGIYHERGLRSRRVQSSASWTARTIIDGRRIRPGDAVLGLARRPACTPTATRSRATFFSTRWAHPDARVPGLRLTLGEELLRVHPNYRPAMAELARRCAQGRGAHHRRRPDRQRAARPARRVRRRHRHRRMDAAAHVPDHAGGWAGAGGGDVPGVQHGRGHGARSWRKRTPPPRSRRWARARVASGASSAARAAHGCNKETRTERILLSWSGESAAGMKKIIEHLDAGAATSGSVSAQGKAGLVGRGTGRGRGCSGRRGWCWACASSSVRRPRNASRRPFRHSAFTAKTFQTSRGQMIYHESGTGAGPALMFIHNVGVGASSYAVVEEFIRPSRTVTASSRRICSGSANPSGPSPS